MLIIRMSRLLSPIAAITQRSNETCALFHVGVGPLEVWHSLEEREKKCIQYLKIHTDFTVRYIFLLFCLEYIIH